MNETSEFTIVQLVPDPIADERINVGIVVLHRGRVYPRFIKKSHRVRQFARDFKLERVHDFERTLYMLEQQGPTEGQTGLPLVGAADPSSVQFVRDAAQNWSHQIQCTPIQPSLEPPLELLERLAKRYLKEPVQSAREGLSSTQIASHSAKELRDAIPTEAVGSHKVEMFRQSPGRIIPHVPIDVRLMNGELKAAVRAVSFQGASVKDMNQNWTNALLALTDLRSAHPDAIMSLHVAAPVHAARDVRSVFEEAEEAASNADVGFVLLDQVDRWAKDTVQRTVH